MGIGSHYDSWTLPHSESHIDDKKDISRCFVCLCLPLHSGSVILHDTPMQKPNQNNLLRVQDGLLFYFDDVCDDLSDIKDEFGSFYHYSDHNPEVKKYAQLSLATLEPGTGEISRQHLDAFALGHVAAQLCTRFDGEILLSVHSQDDTPADSRDFRELLNRYFAQTSEVYGLSQTFIDTGDSESTLSTELYMTEAAILLADLSNLKRHALEQQITEALSR